MTDLVRVRELELDYHVGGHRVRALDGVDIAVRRGDSVAIVGESGSGKSTLGLAVGLVLPPNASIVSGQLAFEGRSVLSFTARELREYRRNELGFVFQSPAAALDPTRRVHRQMRDALDLPRGDQDEILRLLGRVGFARPAEVAAAFPHELSGGMAQRVVVAMAIGRNPKVVIGDEPTASLDSSVRDQVLNVLFGLPREIGAAVVILTHDLRSVASRCARIAVMYGGRVVESGSRQQVLESARHPYTAGLLAATPGTEAAHARLVPIGGVPPVLRERADRCAYAPRCPLATRQCFDERPEARQVDGRLVICHHAEQMRPEGSAVVPASATR
jgi:oligopeptide/dipeptide ABC transporter ATP-binding protein